MSLNSALSIANSGLANINAQFAVVSQNVANASTPGYAAEVSNQQALTADGMGLGVRTGPATLQIDQALQSSQIQQNAAVAAGQTTQRALQAIDGVLGTPGAGNDLTSLLGNLQDSFSTLLTDPSNETQQRSVVSAAQTLAKGINTLSAAYTTQRQAAQDSLQSEIGTLNTTLSQIGQVSNQIMTLRSTNQSTADLENQRNALVQTVSRLVNVKAVEQANGDLTLFTSNGLSLPTHSGSIPFSIQPASTPASSYYPHDIPGIMMGGADVTNQLASGQIGANIALRDTIMPTNQAELDEFSQGLSSRFAAQGLTLFTDGAGNVPGRGGTPLQNGYVGYAASIQVNQTVIANPSLVRDCNTTTSTFTPNPSTGPAGFTGLVKNIVSYTFASTLQNGSAQPALNTKGLGQSGNLSAPFNGAGTALSDFITNLISSQSQQSATTTSQLTTDQALQTSLNSKAAAVSGVDMDTEMAHMLNLQNAYTANARVIAAVQAMFNQLLQSIQ